MTPPAPVADLVESATLDEIYGFMCLQSVRQIDVPRADIVQALLDAGLDPKLAPQNLGPGSAFRRACERYHQRKIEDRTVGGVDITRTVMIRPVVDDAGQMVRRLVVETRDAQADQQLAYDDATYDLVYDKAKQKAEAVVRAEVLHSGNLIDPAVKAIAEEVIDTWSKLVGTVSAQHIRDVLTRAVNKAGAVTMRETGAVWFVPVDRADMVERIEDFASKFPMDGSRRFVQFDAVPLPKTAKQRRMVIDAIESANERDIQALMGRLRTALTDGTDSKGVAALQGEFAALKARTDRYRALLSDQLDATSTGLEIVDRQMSELVLKAVA
jgi:hypothetical protein